MRALILSLLAMTLAVAALLSIKHFSSTSSQPQPTPQLRVTTSFYPLFFFASRIAGDQALVTNITPAGSEPHDYELSVGDRTTIAESDMLILIGDTLEPWGDSIRQQLQGSGPLILATGETLANQTMREEGQEILDPHVWLDPLLAKQQVETIRQGFEAIDPAHADIYQTNAANLKAELEQLDSEFREGLKSCAKNTFVTAHASFGYLASRYGITQQAISGISPEEEPSPQKLAEITDTVRAQNIDTIFMETLASPKFSETIARETGARIAVLDPIEGISQEDILTGKDYFTIMRTNLTHLKQALQCR